MHYYIYPNGGNAKNIGFALEKMGARYLDSMDLDRMDSNSNLNKSIESSNKDSMQNRLNEIKNATFSFLDDKEENTSLATNAAQITAQIKSQNARLLISSKRIQDKLLDNARNLQIPKVVDGIDFSANALNEFYKMKFKDQKAIGILLGGFERNKKHLGSICQILEDRGFKLVYILPESSLWYEEIKADLISQEKEFVLGDVEFVEALCFFAFLLELANIQKPHPLVRSLKLVTSCELFSNLIVSPQDGVEVQNLSFYESSYVNCHTKRQYKRLLQMQSFRGANPNPAPKIVCGGYPSLEIDLARLSQERSKNTNLIESDLYSIGLDLQTPRDSVICPSSHFNFKHPKEFEKIVKNLLKCGFRVVFKSCPATPQTANEENIFAEKFKNFPNFVFYTAPRLNADEINRAIAIIECYSSMAWSFPLCSLRPAILLYPRKSSINAEILRDDFFYEDRLHIRLFKEQWINLPKILKKLQSEESQKFWAEKIIDFRKNELFNFGRASEAIADFICEFFARREILEN